MYHLMTEPFVNTNNSSQPESSLGLFLRGLSGLAEEKDREMYRMQQELDYYKDQQNQLPQTSVVAEGMQNELIAIFNAMHARGMVTCSKKEFMERMANALGLPGIADYSRQLNKIKQTYKYPDIFDKLKETAIQERDKNDD